MAYEFKLADIGEGVVEGEIVSWYKQVGDTIAADEPLVDVMTDKATVQITSPVGGKISKLGGAVGDVVPVAGLLAVIDNAGGGAAAAPAKAAPAAAKAAAPAPVAVAAKAGGGSGAHTTMHEVGAFPSGKSGASGGNGGAGRPVLAAPATRLEARKLGVDLGAVSGSGPGGRVRIDDVRAAAAGGGSAPAAKPAKSAPALALAPVQLDVAVREEEEVVPMRGLRRLISTAMTRSKYTAPHFTYVEEIDFTELNKLRAAAKPIAEKQGIKISVLPFIVKALVPALRKFPRLNAHFDDEANALRVKKYYNIGIATATDAGLMVPVIKHVEHLSVMQIASEMQRLAAASRASKASSDELKGSTFTVTSTGNLGGVLATPILNYPEVAIMGVHRVKPTPVVRDGQIVVRDIGHVSISLDHRSNDGSDAAEFVAELAKYLENPGLMML